MLVIADMGRDGDFGGFIRQASGALW